MSAASQSPTCKQEVATRLVARTGGTTVFDEVVSQLKEIDRRTGLERTIAIGEVILDRFFRGDPDVWRDRRRNKTNSIRRLAERAECPYSRSGLSEAVAVCVAVHRLPCVRTFGHICAGHVASVLGLAVADQASMLERAERERWSVRELRLRVTERRRAGGERRGRPPVGGHQRCVSLLCQRVKQLADAIDEIESAGAVGTEVGRSLLVVALELRDQRSRIERLATVDPEIRQMRPGAPFLEMSKSRQSA